MPRRKRSSSTMKHQEPSALEDWASSKEAADQERAHGDLQLWRAWKESDHHPEHLDPLLKRLEPMIAQKTRQLGSGAAQIDQTALRAQVTKEVIKGLYSYDPDKGAALGTHLFPRASKAGRWVGKNQNLAYIPEGKASRIGDINRAEAALREEGEEPNSQAISSYFQRTGQKLLTPKQIDQIRKRQIKDVPASAFESNPVEALNNREREVLGLIHHELTPQERQLAELGFHPTNPITGTNDLAKKMGISAPEVSTLKSRVLAKIRSNM